MSKMSPEMRLWRATVRRCTDDYMENKKLSAEDVESCRNAVENIRSKGGAIPRRSLGMLIEYDMRLPVHIAKRLIRD